MSATRAKRDLHRAIEGLPRPDRLLIVLSAADGLSPAEIGQVLDRSADDVRRRLFHLKDFLRSVIRH